MFVAKRSKDNPVLIPERNHYWEAFATFNMSVVKEGRYIYGLYRAISAHDMLRVPNQVSIIGLARSKDGEHFEDRMPFIEPEHDWEKFGCEDPRITYFEGYYYIFYTALSTYPFGPDGIKVAVARSKDLKKVTDRHPVTPFNAKAMTLFPERVDGKITVIFSAHTDQPPAKIAIAQFDKIEDLWSPQYWEEWHHNLDAYTLDDLRRNDFDHVEVGASPIKTKYGWLLIYSYTENYFGIPDKGRRQFGIEAVLLDLKDPRKVLGKTKGPFIHPEESYEINGHVSNIVFPTGAILEKDVLSIYYGAADTTSCVAYISLKDLISSINPTTSDKWYFKRGEKNPILAPNPNHPWESKAVFNPAAIDLKKKVHILYRALSEDNTSVIGYATSKDGMTIDERLPDPIYVPTEDFESKKVSGGNSGCEDPRITKVGDTLYMCYTAFDGVGPPRVAITSIKESDFLARHWRWKKPVVITPHGVDDKDTCILPEKVGGKYCVLHRIGTDICADYVHSLDFKTESINKCIRVLGPRPGLWDGTKVGITAPPVKTKYGWLLFYHAVSENHHGYRVGAALLDLKDPTEVLARSTDPIFEPKEKYEKEGIVNNVVFPCGLVVRDSTVYIYYGGADRVLGVASMDLDVVLDSLVRSTKF